MTDSYIQLAQETLTAFFEKRQLKNLSLSPELLNKKAGVFVSLHLSGQLRGCIGTISPTTKNIAEEIKQNALSAAFEDPRFMPLTKNELKNLEISVDVLNPAELIDSKSELDPKKYGVIVEAGNRRGLLLPDIEGVDTIDQQIEIACSKAGIDLSEKFKIYKFTVTRHGQK